MIFESGEKSKFLNFYRFATVESRAGLGLRGTSVGRVRELPMGNNIDSLPWRAGQGLG